MQNQAQASERGAQAADLPEPCRRRCLLMKLELTDRQFRYLLDLVYIGNWVLNATRGDDRIEEYD